jgi:PST family polysaccharide transporter
MNTEVPTLGGQQMARKTARAVFWNYASFGLGKFLVFITTAILARLLSPDDFGLVALATLAVNYLSVLKDLGLGDALIQRREDVEEAANTVFTLNLILGVVLTLASVAIAPLAAAYFRQPLVIPLLRALGLTFAINALGSVHIVMLQRQLDFRRKLIPDIGRSIVKGVVSIGCALAGMGAWALVIGQLAGVVIGVLIAWAVYPWRPRLMINSKLAFGLLKFGMSLIIIQVFTVIEDNLDYLIIGRRFGEAPLGIYTLAYRLPEMLVISLLWVMASVIFPAYSTVQDQPDILRRGFLATIRFTEILAVPICLGLFLAADPIVRVVFGPQWLEAIPVLRVLAIFALFTSIGFNVGDVYKAVGRPDILVKLSIAYLATLTPALIFGANFGLVGVAFGHLTVSFIYMFVRIAVATRFVKVNLWDILGELKPSLLGGLALSALVIPSLYLTAGLAPLWQLLIIVTAGAVGYLSVLWFIERDSLLKVGRILGVSGSANRKTGVLAENQ